jgi:hypothetical protein
MRGPPAIKRRSRGMRNRVGASQGCGSNYIGTVSDHKWRILGPLATVLATAASLPPPGSAVAQDRAAVGAEVGYSRADLTGEASNLVESRQGAITGVYLHLPVNPLVSVRPELLFSLRGGRTLAQIAGTDDIADVDIELAYLEVPLLARLNLPRGRIRPAVFGGPSLALQIGCDVTLETDTLLRFTCGQDSVSQIREWDLAWIAGAALEMHLPRTTLSLQGRYTAGFRSVFDEPIDLRNRGMALLFGLTF